MIKILIKNFFFKKVLLAAFFLTAFFLSNLVSAAVVVTPASGGTNISADNAANASVPAYTTLGNIVITSGAQNDFAKNVANATLILTAPSNWAFNAGVGTGSAAGTAITFNSISVTASTITVTYTRTKANSSNASLTISGIQVRSTNGSILPNSGSILRTAANPGTGSITGITNGVTNFGSLSQVVGVKNKLAFTTQPSSSVTVATDFTTKPVVTLQDQFGTTISADSASTITRTAVLSTQTCGGTAGTGTLSSTPSSCSAVTSGVMTYTAMQYSYGEAIKICVASTGVTSALSNTITVNNPVPTTTSISPTSKTLGDAQFTLTVNGTNFVSNSVVNFSGSARSTTYVNSTQLTAIIPATDLLSAGAFNITVFNSTPTGGTSNTQTFTVNAAPDTTAPAAVSNLATTNPTNNSIDITWTAPGDDNDTGTATTYDVRYSTSAITSGNFASATAVTGEPTPSIAGSSESITVSGLSASTLYYFALKTSDEVPNASAISNVPTGTTSATSDITAPTVTAFSIPSTSDSLTVTITTFTATDNVGVAKYLLNESASTPSVSDSNWASSAPANYVFSTEGSKTLYAWAKDASGNISASLSATVIITLSVAPSQSVSGQAASGGVQPTVVSFSGRAYPNGKIRIYRRSLIESVFKNDYLPNFDIDIDSDGNFNKTFTGLLQSNYLFALEGIDKDGQSGGIISFTADLLSGNSLIVNEIFLPPTISVQNKFITKGNEIKVAGYAYPNSNIELKVDNILGINSVTNDSGYYEAVINTSRFSPKTYFVAVKQTNKDGKASEFSTSKNFTISALNYPQADFNGDNTIDIKDWSIFLFRWKANPIIRAFNDLNLDGKVDISDLSIFLKAMKGL